MESKENDRRRIAARLCDDLKVQLEAGEAARARLLGSVVMGGMKERAEVARASLCRAG